MEWKIPEYWAHFLEYKEDANRQGILGPFLPVVKVLAMGLPVVPPRLEFRDTWYSVSGSKPPM